LSLVAENETLPCEDGIITNNIFSGNGVTEADINTYIAMFHKLNFSNNRLLYGASYGVYVALSDDSTFSGNTITNNPSGIHLQDGDDCIISNNRIQATTPIDIDDADCVRTVVTGNNWEGSTNDISSGAATNPRIASNIDKTGAWAWGDNVQ
jgi:parallel beta-helix repeat protein